MLYRYDLPGGISDGGTSACDESSRACTQRDVRCPEEPVQDLCGAGREVRDDDIFSFGDGVGALVDNLDPFGQEFGCFVDDELVNLFSPR